MGGDGKQGKRKHEGGGGKGGGNKKFRFPGVGASQSYNSIIPRGGLESPGLLLTLGNGKEFVGAREVASILEEYHERKTAKAGPSRAEQKADKGPVDISKELAAEVAGLKDRRAHFLEILNTDIRGIMYVRWNPESHRGETAPDLNALVREYLEDVAKTQQTRSRWIIRIFPSQMVCFAGLEEIKAAVAELVKTEMPAVEGAAPGSLGPYSVVYDHRAAPKGLKREDVIKAVAEMVPECYKVDLKNPSMVLSVQVVKSSCCIGVVRDWIKFERYNVRRVAGEETGPQAAGEGKKPKEAAEEDKKDEEEEQAEEEEQDA